MSSFTNEFVPKRVIFLMPCKGGVGKTTVAATLAEFYKSKDIPVELLDMDPENKGEGSLAAMFPSAISIPATESDKYNDLLDKSLESEAEIILAETGGAQSYQMIPWIQRMYKGSQLSGIPVRWTAVGVVDSELASVRPIIEWGEALQQSVDYLIIKNRVKPDSKSAWDDPKVAEDVKEFCTAFKPNIIQMEDRNPGLQELMRKHNVTLSDVVDRKTDVAELLKPSMRINANLARTSIFKQLTLAHKVLLPTLEPAGAAK
jgi:hypothetical protein